MGIQEDPKGHERILLITLPGRRQIGPGDVDRTQKIVFYGVNITIAFAFVFFFWPTKAHAAFSDWSDSFDTYTPGTICGQGMWTCVGGTVPTVSATLFYDGTLSLTSDATGNDEGQKTPSYDLYGVSRAYFRFYHRAVTGNTDRVTVSVKSGASWVWRIELDDSGNYDLWDGVNYPARVNCATGISQDTWHEIIIDFNTVAETVRCKIDGGTWSATTPSNTAVSAATVLDIWYVGTDSAKQFVDDVEVTTSEPEEPAEDDTTRFDSFSPTLGSATLRATSTAFTFGATGYINQDQIEEDQYLYIRWRNVSHGVLGSCTAALSWGEIELDIATSSNEFDVSTTTPILCYGSYAAYYAIRQPGWSLLGFQLWEDTILDASGTFIVGTTTGNGGAGYQPSAADIYNTDLLFESGMGVNNFIPNEANASTTIFGIGAGFLDIRAQMISKFPISWAIETISVIMEETNESATSTLSEYEIDFGGYANLQWVSTTTADDLVVPILSWEWIDTLADISAWQALRALTGYLMYLGVGVLAWRESARMFRELTT